ncbi:M1 family metallopeptidase [Geosporobacter ferrireducens]|uniref:Peptidase M1 membrane alanine aminopeptidase domain-containing protein n=1 Tax=Geosporobacter ferrireducens TaxID=1424294 RepID=A0A1D8GI29_9FIRM|nr:M1 family metallopeptidase [Geosporobacter ferrireducens]AOT70540.1 hypothetical protein Gferi_13745 [Geosporobacter ferrireducens]
MKQQIKRKLILCSVVLLSLTMSFTIEKLDLLDGTAAVFSQREKRSKAAANEYVIKAEFDSVEKLLVANEKISYTNMSDTNFQAIYFHLYPNTFKTKDTVPFDEGEMMLAYPKGFEPGYIQITSVESNGEALNYAILGVGETILKVNLNQPLESRSKIDLEIIFTVKIPPSNGRFGYGENTINIANWYPIAAMYDSRGWNLEPYYAIGDPFYSDIANYRVYITMLPEYTLASTGNIIKRENIGGKALWTIEAKNVRDFAMITGEKYKVLEDEIDGVKIKSYFIDDTYGDLALQTAKDAVGIFNKAFGKYPYKQLSVAAADFFIGGMEYPNLVFIDQSLYQEDHKDILEYVVAHEVAHQWWYGIVGNDQVNEPWLDEALTEYSTLVYYEKKYGNDVKENVYKNMIARMYQAYHVPGTESKEKIYKSLKEFDNAREYQALVYSKGAIFIGELRKELGEQMFFQIMKVYFDKYRFKHATTEDFIKLCEQISDRELQDYFNKWLNYNQE